MALSVKAEEPQTLVPLPLPLRLRFEHLKLIEQPNRGILETTKNNNNKRNNHDNKQNS